MFPTLASLLEERLSDDPVAIHVLVHALNEWLDEVWGFNYQNRIFTTPVITLPIVEKAIEELDGPEICSRTWRPPRAALRGRRGAHRR